MKLYKIVKPVCLDFLTPRDQVTMVFGEGFVEWDGAEKSWYLVNKDGEKRETINWGWVIAKYIKDGHLVED